MKKSNAEMIDAYTHVLPVKYWEILEKKARNAVHRELNDRVAKTIRGLMNIDARLREMD